MGAKHSKLYPKYLKNRLLWALGAPFMGAKHSKLYPEYIKNLSKHIKNHQNLPKCIKSHQKTTKSIKYQHKPIKMDKKPINHRQNISKPPKTPPPKYINNLQKTIKMCQKPS